jgi:hypothetical protein
MHDGPDLFRGYTVACAGGLNDEKIIRAYRQWPVKARLRVTDAQASLVQVGGRGSGYPPLKAVYNDCRRAISTLTL